MRLTKVESLAALNSSYQHIYYNKNNNDNIYI